ncbi:SDR family NAD(P)-dependent oxidoreductase [Leptolyngbya sp. FACHB-261]|uniref:SDR family NAD(P)-dependent oxidoreductase n=1 Tax=Leptolyngbya sp. FACHB-261 TaxID=2692806 RepID=UPI0016885F00|nr:SDR family NAD(P)-dependent oxidoreductase [Leptolyngbya sp. FACHB-261]MBD2102826.1 SDR family NAD(P)-dependent oxidoreductase [Leptolyngbya sp. FACHB-261]
MDLALKHKRALITGSSAGTGAAIAKTLAREGAHVVVHGRNSERAETVAAESRAEGGKAAVVIGDLSTTAGAQQVAHDALEALGGVDILVNNAALIGYYETWDDVSAEDWAAMYDGVVLVIVRLVNALKPHMETLGWGRIINIASAQSLQPFAMMPDYAAAKCAVLNLTKSLSKRFDRTGVTVNVVSPGIIVTEQIRQRMTEAAAREGRSTEWEEIERHVLTTELDNPTGRLAQPEDIANLVTFLSSPLAGYINGTNIRIDGGSIVTL